MGVEDLKKKMLKVEWECEQMEQIRMDMLFDCLCEVRAVARILIFILELHEPLNFVRKYMKFQ